MLENPYYAAPSNIPVDAGLYRGEGRIEESAHGISIIVRWESTLAEGVAAQWRLQKKLGTLKTVRYAQVFYVIVGVSCLLMLAIFNITAQLHWILLLGLSGAMFLMVFLQPLSFRYAVRKLVVNMRGTKGAVDVTLTLDPTGVQHEYQDMAWVFRWRGVREIDVTKKEINFIRQPIGLIHVPIRVFPDAATLERFVRLGRKYAGL